MLTITITVEATSKEDGTVDYRIVADVDGVGFNPAEAGVMLTLGPAELTKAVMDSVSRVTGNPLVHGYEEGAVDTDKE